MIITTLGAMIGLPLGTYDGSYIRLFQFSTDGTIYGKFKSLLLRAQFVSVVGLDIGRVIGTIIL